MARVLLVDDEETLRILMARQLRGAGHEVTQAEDGLAAFELLKENAFDVVVTDIKMPRLDGIGLLARASEVAPGTEFIVLTGHGSLENAVDAFKTGIVFDYLKKPLEDIHELDAVVARALERRHLKAENARLVTELERRIDELAHWAERDGLTGLFNHRTIYTKLEQALSADEEGPIAVVTLDMDGFKQFNDTYGHLVGDQVLQHIANVLEAACGEETLLGRCGGDEFMVVLPGAVADDAQRVAMQIQRGLTEKPFRNPEGTALPITLCFGIADTVRAGRSPVGLAAAADTALFEGKRRGGDSVMLHMAEESGEDGCGRTFNTLDGLVTAIDNKDRYTRKHSEDVTRYALLLAQSLHLSKQTYNAVRLAGLLHDVGKIGIPDSILRKPGKLTDEEYEVMKGHVTISALIIHGLPSLSDILDAVAHHHERWDGKGYPKGLAGEQIPLLGRVMAIADAFSAMTLDRPYRAGMTVDEALAEIERGSGTQFDPTLAPLFIDAIRETFAPDERGLPKAA